MGFKYKPVKGTTLRFQNQTLHKAWTVTDETQANYGIVSYSGQYSNGDWNISDPQDSNIALEEQTGDYYRREIFDSIRHVYYKDPYNKRESGDSQYYSDQIKTLHREVRVVSIPGRIFGDRIREGSVTMSNGATTIIYDDGKGNLIDTSISAQTNFKSFKNSDYYLKLDATDAWQYMKGNLISDTTFKSISDKYITPSIESRFNPKCMNVTFGFHTGSTVLGRHGVSGSTYISLHGSQSLQTGSNSLIQIENSLVLDNESAWNKDFALSLWVRAPLSQSVTQSFTGGWQPTSPGTLSDQDTIPESRVAQNSDFSVIASPRQHEAKLPWELQIFNSRTTDKGKLRFKRGAGYVTTDITSSAAINTNEWNHVVLQVATGSMQMWVNGTLQATKTDPNVNSITKDPTTDIIVGGRRWLYKTRLNGPDTNDRVSGLPIFNNVNQAPNFIHPFKGDISMFRLFSRALTTLEISSLYNYLRDTNTIGNIFYNHGMAVITDLSGSYEAMMTSYELKFKGSRDVRVHNYACTVENGDYNVTLNPSARVNHNINSEKLSGFATSSDFNPYITTIGLYDDMNHCLAIAKLAYPLQSPRDVDITFNVQFDE